MDHWLYTWLAVKGGMYEGEWAAFWPVPNPPNVMADMKVATNMKVALDLFIQRITIQAKNGDVVRVMHGHFPMLRSIGQYLEQYHDSYPAASPERFLMEGLYRFTMPHAPNEEGNGHARKEG